MSNYLMFSDSFDPHVNLARETALADMIAPTDFAMYLWRNERTVVIGRNQNAWRECRCELLAQEGGALARRMSGGGAVYHDLGNLNFTFIASPERYDTEKHINLIISALKSMGVDAEFSGRNDITVDGFKISGSAYKYTKQYSMQHGTLLIDTDAERLARYLTPSLTKLRAKGIESVRARVRNVRDINPDITPERVAEALVSEYSRTYGEHILIDENALDISENYALYSSWDWIFGETPVFDVEIERRFEWGEMQLMLTLENGRVRAARVFTDAMDSALAERVSAALTGAIYAPTLAERVAFMPEIAEWLVAELPL